MEIPDQWQPLGFAHTAANQITLTEREIPK
jgi:hypothetical protein